MLSSSRLLPLLLLVSSCAWEAPPYGRSVPENVVSGSIFVAVPDVQGDAIVFLTDAENPMPPLGTGSPATFAAVPLNNFGGAGGLSAADFTVTGVPDGNWTVTGLLDVDQDFHPLVPGSALAGATCGDVIGAWVADLSVPLPTVLSVSGGELASNVTVTLARQLTTERPAFTLQQAGALSRVDAAASPQAPQGFRLESTGVFAGFGSDVSLRLDGPFNPDAPQPCQTGFLVEVPDADGDGQPDAHPFLPAPFFDVSPDIFLQWLPPTDDSGAELGPDGEPLDGRSWASIAVPSPAGVQDGSLPAPGSGPALVPHLDLLWIPAGTASQDGRPEVNINDPRDLPEGAYAVTVVLPTGQTWTVPNGLAAAVSTQPDRFDPATQGAVLLME